MKKHYIFLFLAALMMTTTVERPAQAESAGQTTVDVTSCTQLLSLTAAANTTYVVTAPLACTGNVILNIAPSLFKIGTGGSLSVTGILSIKAGSATNGGTGSGNGGTVTITNTGTTPILTSGGAQPLNVNLIHNCQELQNISNSVGASYQLANDIDCSNVAFVPIGYQSSQQFTNPFLGTLDGQNHKIKNLTINYNSQYVGLFGILQNPATVSRLVFENSNISGPSDVGTLAGEVNVPANLKPGVEINQVIVNNGIVNGSWAGGLVGFANGGGFLQSGVNNIVVNGADAGGLIGVSYYATITNGFSSGIIKGQGAGGGLIGFYDDGMISNSYSTAQVIAAPLTPPYIYNPGYAGGLIGVVNGSHTSLSLTSPIISNSYAAGKVSASGNAFAGGVVGYVSYLPQSNFPTGTYWDINATGQNTDAFSTDMAKNTSQLQQQVTYYGWDFSNIWVIGTNRYPAFRWLEQSQIDLWNVFTAASQENIFKYFMSALNTVNWSQIDVAYHVGVNWDDLWTLSRPPVWNNQPATTSTVDWGYLTGLSDAGLNWVDMYVLTTSGIKWASVNPLVKSGVNWSDWANALRAGINWKAVSVISNLGIDWNNMGTSNDRVQWSNLAMLSRENINWSNVYLLNRKNVNWDDPVTLKLVPMTATDLYTLRTIGVPPITSNSVKTINVLVQIQSNGIPVWAFAPTAGTKVTILPSASWSGMGPTNIIIRNLSIGEYNLTFKSDYLGTLTYYLVITAQDVAVAPSGPLQISKNVAVPLQ